MNHLPSKKHEFPGAEDFEKAVLDAAVEFQESYVPISDFSNGFTGSYVPIAEFQ